MLDIKNRETLEIYVLGDDFKFYQNLKYLPLTSYPSNNQSALIILFRWKGQNYSA